MTDVCGGAGPAARLCQRNIVARGKESAVTTERIRPPLIAGVREMLRAFLDYHRATLALKCDGLPDEDLRRQSVNAALDPSGHHRERTGRGP